MDFRRVGLGAAIMTVSAAVVLLRLELSSTRTMGPFVNGVAQGEGTFRMPGTTEQVLLLLAWLVGIGLIVAGIRSRRAM